VISTAAAWLVGFLIFFRFSEHILQGGVTCEVTASWPTNSPAIAMAITMMDPRKTPSKCEGCALPRVLWLDQLVAASFATSTTSQLLRLVAALA
jgi:hypothetical protein